MSGVPRVSRREVRSTNTLAHYVYILLPLSNSHSLLKIIFSSRLSASLSHVSLQTYEVACPHIYRPKNGTTRGNLTEWTRDNRKSTMTHMYHFDIMLTTTTRSLPPKRACHKPLRDMRTTNVTSNQLPRRVSCRTSRHRKI